MSIFLKRHTILITTFSGILVLFGAISETRAQEVDYPLLEKSSPTNVVIESGDFIKPVSQYKQYVMAEIAELVVKTELFTQAIQAGSLEEAQALYAPARVHYERVEPAAEIFSDLDSLIDAREDDFKLGAADPEFIGFHRIEKILFDEQTTEGAEVYAEQLLKNVRELQVLLKDKSIPVVKMVQGAADLMEEIAMTKITGEEDRYSKTDLWDFSANLEGSRKIVDLLRPLLQKADPKLLAKLDIGFKDATMTLHQYKLKDGEGFELYGKVTEADKMQMKSQISLLSEQLATLRGTLGLDN